MNLKETLIKASVQNQNLKLEKVSDIVEKSQNFLQMEFVFSDVWKSDGIKKIICQFRKNNEVYDVELTGNVCDVPWEVLSSSGTVYVCVYAVGDGNTIITTGSENFRVMGGAYKDDAQTSNEATPTVYTQLSLDVEELKQKTRYIDKNGNVTSADGKVLSDNNFSSSEKEKLNSLQNYDDTEVKNTVAINTENISVLQETVEGLSSDNAEVKTEMNSVKTQLNNDIAKMNAEIENKVDNVDGKGLSANDFTDECKEKLAGLENYDDEEIVAEVDELKSDLEQFGKYTGIEYSLVPVKGKSISANVGGIVTFLDNAQRMYYKFKPLDNFYITNIATKIAVIKATEGTPNDKCISNSSWTKENQYMETDGSYVFYVLCDFIDENKTPNIFSDGVIKTDIEELKNANIVYDSEISNLKTKNLANQYGYNSAINFVWEDGSINIGNGTNTDTSPNVIRTKEPITFDDDVQIIVTTDAFRVKPFRYTADGKTYVSHDAWNNGVCNETYKISKDYSYRFQIATNDGSSVIDKKKALAETIFCLANNVSNGNLPNYWKAYLETKVQTINEYMTDGSEKTAFMLLTDTHWNESESLNSRGINTLVMQYIKDRCNIDYLVHCGDLNSEYRSNKNIARECITKPMSMMCSVFDNVLITRGNHDDNIEGSNNVWDYVITQSDSYSYMFRNTQNAIFGKTGTYFYHDVPFENVRYISLDCVDMVYSNSVDSTKCDQKILAYGYEQLQWLCDTLANTPDNYHIIIFTHNMLAPSNVTIDHPTEAVQTRAKNCLVLCDILKAFKTRTNYSFDMTRYFTTVHQDYYDGVLTGNFEKSNATIVAVFSGHEHVDCIEEILDSSGNGIGIYNTCTQNSSAMFDDSVISHTYQAKMEIDTVTELVLDIVVIDRKNKSVKMLRIGAGNEEVRNFNY